MPNLVWPYRTVALLTLVGNTWGQQVVNVHHFQAATAAESGMPDDAAAITWANAIMTDWLTTPKTAWLACHTTEYTLQMVKVQVIERPGNWRHKLTTTENPLSTGNVGTVATAATNLTETAVLKWRTTVAGKSHRGRTYVSPITNNWVLQGVLNATGQTALNSYITTMAGKYAVGGTYYNTAALTIYSRPYNEGEYQYASRKTGTLAVVTPPDYAGNATNVLNGLVDPYMRNQRRRQIGVGS